MASQTHNVGVIGYGLSAKVFHIPFILRVPSLKLYAVVQRTPKPEDDAEKDHPGIKAYRSADDLINDPEVEVIVVTTTPETHFAFCKQALEAGKNVIVEKPFVPTSKEGYELDKIAKDNKKLLAVYQNRRWDSDYLTLSEILKSKALGRVAEFETHFDRHRPDKDTSGSWKTKPQAGGGVLYDLGSHIMDQIVHSFGMPDRVTGFISSEREGNSEGPEDTCTILLHYNDMLATAKATVISPEENQLRFWVRGTKGSFKKYHLDVQEPQLRDGMRPGAEGFGVEPESHHGVLTSSEGGKITSRTYPTVKPATYEAFYQMYADALDGKGEVPVSAEDAANVIRLIELAKQSFAEGKTLWTY